VALAVVVAWVVTFAVSVPLHGVLAAGKDAAAIEQLIRTNWLRTAAWTVAAVAGYIAVAGSSAGR
jgi:hypothetical protein